MQDYQGYLIYLLPIIMPLIGSSMAALLTQSHWRPWVNDAIAWLVLLGCAALNVWLSNQLIGGVPQIVDAIIAAVTVLVSGPLTKLRPWLAWLDWLQSHAGILLPLTKSASQASTPQQWRPRVSSAVVPPGDPRG
jgi:hypothetical protein